MSKPILLHLALAILLAAPVGVPAQPAWPAKPVKFVVPTGTGGGTDTVGRLFADLLGKAIGQSFVVENRPGANGMIATELVAKAANDGYTILFTYAAAQVVNPSLYAKVGYDPVRDFAAIAQIGSGGNWLLVPASMPVQSLKDFIDYVKARPDELAYGSWGNGSGGHLSMESLKMQAGLKMRHVPYKSSAASVADLLAGHIQVAFGDTSSNLPHIQAGKLRAIAISGTRRAANLPEVATMTEQGVPFNLMAWYGVFAPAGTPPAVINRLNQEINRILTAPELADRLRGLGFTEIPVKSPEQFAETVRTDVRDWGALVRAANVKVE